MASLAADHEAQSLLKDPYSPTIEEALVHKELQLSQVRLSQRRHRRFLFIGLCTLLGCALLTVIATGWLHRDAHPSSKRSNITLDHIFNGTFSPQFVNVRWISETGEDGVFAVHDHGVIKLVDLSKNETTNLVFESQIIDPNMPSSPLYFSTWSLSPRTTSHILVKAYNRKQWRHSSIGQYFIHHIPSAQTFPLFNDYPSVHGVDEAYAEWLPGGDGVVVVRGGDLYLVWVDGDHPPSQPIRITSTSTGNSTVTTMFNGVPDWVYEEEVFASEKALWVSALSESSPDAGAYRLAYLTLNSTLVQTYTYSLYNPTEDPSVVMPYVYPQQMEIPYPKPGTPNPIATVNVAILAKDKSPTIQRLTWPTQFPPEDSIIQEVSWVGDSELIIKEVDRNAQKGNVVWFGFSDNLEGGTVLEGRVVRTLGTRGEEGDEGWIECSQNIRPLPTSISSELPISHDGSESKSAYLDIVPNADGFLHLALFSPSTTTTPTFLTSGTWEIDGGILGISTSLKRVFFRATISGSIERGVYSVGLGTASSDVEIVGGMEGGYWGAQFSPHSGYYVLEYLGPGVPYQQVKMIEDSDFSYPLTTNDNLRTILNSFALPEVRYGTVEIDGFEMNYKEIRPPHMDETGNTKYPVLFNVYGGPGSQMVKQTYSTHFMEYLAGGLGYIGVVVDGRGTGFKGRKHRNPVKNNLGFWETYDQVEAGRIWSQKPYVDPTKIGVWGWSFGGYMAAKIAERDAGVHSLAMSVAPVTDWRLYDSIYTERYMSLPAVNKQGYKQSGVHNVTGFSNIDYLLAHGSGDDNVHFSNSARLVDMLTSARIRGWRFRMFTDSDHSIRRRGANREVYQFMVDFLLEKWGLVDNKIAMKIG